MLGRAFIIFLVVRAQMEFLLRLGELSRDVTAIVLTPGGGLTAHHGDRDSNGASCHVH